MRDVGWKVVSERKVLARAEQPELGYFRNLYTSLLSFLSLLLALTFLSRHISLKSHGAWFMNGPGVQKVSLAGDERCQSD